KRFYSYHFRDEAYNAMPCRMQIKIGFEVVSRNMSIPLSRDYQTKPKMGSSVSDVPQHLKKSVRMVKKHSKNEGLQVIKIRFRFTKRSTVPTLRVWPYSFEIRFY